MTNILWSVLGYLFLAAMLFGLAGLFVGMIRDWFRNDRMPEKKSGSIHIHIKY